MIKLKNLLTEMPVITKKGEKVYAGDKPLSKIDLKTIEPNMSAWLVKDGNFLFPPGQLIVWFHKTEDWWDKINSGEYDLVLFPPPRRYDFTASPITDVWKKNKKTRGKEEVIGLLYAKEISKGIVIQMMSVRGGYRNNKVNSLMIKYVQSMAPNKPLIFKDPTKMGWKFIEKFASDAMVIDSDNEEVKEKPF